MRHALRLDDAPPPERFDEYENEIAADRDAAATATRGDARPPITTRDVLKRYSSSMVALLARGAERIRAARDATVAELTFFAIIRFYEKIADTEVYIPADYDATSYVREPLVDGARLLEAKLDLLRAYCETRDWHSLGARATILAHLSECLAFRFRLPADQQHSLDTLCYLVAAELVLDEVVQRVPDVNAFVGASHSVSLLNRYANRSDLLDVAEFAQDVLDRCDFDVEGDFQITGTAAFDDTARSPAWRIIGYGARAASTAADAALGSCLELSSIESLLSPCRHVVRRRRSDRGGFPTSQRSSLA